MVHDDIEKLRVLEESRHGPADATVIALGETVTVGAGSETIVVFSIEANFEAFIKEVFADRLADCTYEWRIGPETVNVNEHVFQRVVSLGKGAGETEAMTLKITNNDANEPKELDLEVRGAGVRT